MGENGTTNGKRFGAQHAALGGAGVSVFGIIALFAFFTHPHEVQLAELKEQMRTLASKEEVSQLRTDMNSNDRVVRTETETRFGEITKAIDAHHALEGHPGVMARVVGVEKGLETQQTEVSELRDRVKVIEDRDEWFLRTRVEIQSQIAKLQENQRVLELRCTPAHQEMR